MFSVAPRTIGPGDQSFLTPRVRVHAHFTSMRCGAVLPPHPKSCKEKPAPGFYRPATDWRRQQDSWIIARVYGENNVSTITEITWFGASKRAYTFFFKRPTKKVGNRDRTSLLLAPDYFSYSYSYYYCQIDRWEATDRNSLPFSFVRCQSTPNNSGRNQFYSAALRALARTFSSQGKQQTACS